jgi:nitrous oxide reductase accessory protein NosL
MKIKSAVAGVAMALVTACAGSGDGPPEIVVDRSACSHCGMLISEPLYAAASQTAGAAPKVFDDLGCLRNAARSDSADLRIWVHDAVDGQWIDGAAATFVSSSGIRTPMGGGLLAYRRAADAERAAHQHNGRVVQSWSVLLKENASS